MNRYFLRYFLSIHVCKFIGIDWWACSLGCLQVLRLCLIHLSCVLVFLTETEWVSICLLIQIDYFLSSICWVISYFWQLIFFLIWLISWQAGFLVFICLGGVIQFRVLNPKRFHRVLNSRYLYLTLSSLEYWLLFEVRAVDVIQGRIFLLLLQFFFDGLLFGFLLLNFYYFRFGIWNVRRNFPICFQRRILLLFCWRYFRHFFNFGCIILLDIWRSSFGFALVGLRFSFRCFCFLYFWKFFNLWSFLF